MEKLITVNLYDIEEIVNAITADSEVWSAVFERLKVEKCLKCGSRGPTDNCYCDYDSGCFDPVED
jgi:hypothetical protein